MGFGCFRGKNTVMVSGGVEPGTMDHDSEVKNEPFIQAYSSGITSGFAWARVSRRAMEYQPRALSQKFLDRPVSGSHQNMVFEVSQAW